jgi:hypothetical protein
MGKDLNVRPQTMELLKQNVGEMHQDIGFGKHFLYKTPKAQETKP